MKKLTAVILTLLMVVGICPLTASAAQPSLKMAIATDVHFNAAHSSAAVVGSTQEKPFGHVYNNGKMTAESKAITTEFLNQVANSGAEFLLITGDVADTGKLSDETAIAKMLMDFEAETGITVFCSMGNHESYYGTYQQFKTVFADLGYDKALEIDENSASYTAELNSEYRLICIDSNQFNQELFNWVEKQALQAKQDGKTLISAMHYSLIPHYTLQQFATATLIPTQYHLSDCFIEWGIRFNFSGHTHELDTASYENENGVVYDIISGTLNTYPACYHTLTIQNNKAHIGTEYIEKIDTSLLPSGFSEEAFNLLSTDFRAYAKKMFIEGSHLEFKNAFSTSFIQSYGIVKKGQDDEIIDILNCILPRFNEAISLPLYGEENSLEALAKEYGYTFSPSEYTNGSYAFAELYAAHCAGDENYPIYSTLGALGVNIFGTALNYALEPLTAEQYNSVLHWALQKFNLSVDISDFALSVAADALTKKNSINALVFYVIAPLMNDFVEDTSPSDVNLTVAQSDENDNGIALLWQKFMNFIRQAIAVLYSFFSFLTFNV